MCSDKFSLKNALGSARPSGSLTALPRTHNCACSYGHSSNGREGEVEKGEGRERDGRETGGRGRGEKERREGPVKTEKYEPHDPQGIASPPLAACKSEAKLDGARSEFNVFTTTIDEHEPAALTSVHRPNNTTHTENKTN